MILHVLGSRLGDMERAEDVDLLRPKEFLGRYIFPVEGRMNGGEMAVTLLPSVRRSRAQAAPMPPPAPVTRTICLFI